MFSKSDRATLLGQTGSKSSCNKPESALLYERFARGRYRKTRILAKGLILPFSTSQAPGLAALGHRERDAPEIDADSLLCRAVPRRSSPADPRDNFSDGQPTVSRGGKLHLFSFFKMKEM